MKEMLHQDIHSVDCRVISVEPMNRDVFRIILALPDGITDTGFRAGQYLEILPTVPLRAAYSVANSPGEILASRELELHLRHIPGDTVSDLVLTKLREAGPIRVEMPYGRCVITDPQGRTVVLVAGSTGFSQARSIAISLLENGFKGDLHLFWGGRIEDDFYTDEPAVLASDHQNFHYYPVLSDERHPREGYRTGHVHRAVLQEFGQLADTCIVASGSPAMISAAFHDFQERGASRQNFLSDLFDYQDLE